MFFVPREALTKAKGGYSVLEMLITLVVVNILIVMLSNILVISLRLSAEASARSEAREEITNLLGLIRRDIRNANSVRCFTQSGVLYVPGEGSDPSCARIEITATNNDTIVWREIDSPTNPGSSIVEKTLTEAQNPSNVSSFNTSENLDFETFDISIIDTQDSFGNTTQATFYITLNASHTNENLDITNLVRQETVSTRNF